jgi:UDP-N-acetylmuramoyl-L-alanyl-D-glutamate--2,6-diaminopimelate ligase
MLPSGTVKLLEEGYRKSRVKLLTARYGNPAKNLRVIAVTGTNGKTTVVNFLNEILKEAGYKTALFSTAVIEIAGQRHINDLNRTVAVTGDLMKFYRNAKKAAVDFVLIEATSHALDQHKLSTTPIEMTIMTNLTQDHLDYHKTMENYAAAKAKLFKLQPRYIVLNRDDEWFEYFNVFPAGYQKITYGKSPEADAQISRVKLFRKGTELDMLIDHQTKLELATALPGEFNAYNLAAAVSAAYLLNVGLKDIVEGAANLEGIPGRFDRVPVNQPYDVVVDYAHTPDGYEKLLTAAKEITKNRVLLVFGSCGDRDKAKRPIMGEIAARLADRIFLTDEESYNEDPKAIRDQVYAGIERAHGAAKTLEIPDRFEAIKKALSVATRGDTVLITGMGHEMYRIVNGKRIPWNDAEAVKQILQNK